MGSKVTVIKILANQLADIAYSIAALSGTMCEYSSGEVVDKDCVKACADSISLLMNTATSPQTILQQALNDLNEDLKK